VQLARTKKIILVNHLAKVSTAVRLGVEDVLYYRHLLWVMVTVITLGVITHRLVIGMAVIAVKQHVRTRFIIHAVILFVWIQAQKISRRVVLLAALEKHVITG
jgi:hypothetical protein